MGLVDSTRCYQLLSGIAGIYITYCFASVLHEWMIKLPYLNWRNGEMEYFKYPIAFQLFPYLQTWIIGSIINYLTVPFHEQSHIPEKKAMYCAAIIGIATLTYNDAIYYTTYPIVMMFKSCNLLSVLLVGVCCSRVRDKKLKLAPKKFIVGTIITCGVLLFQFSDPTMKDKKETSTHFLGLFLLIVSMMADGFLPDFQAEIKETHQPKPMEMMVIINKWVALLSLLASIVMLELYDILVFMYEHPQFTFHLLLMGFLSTFGQMFVYRMIKQFKQHFVPFVITVRKISTVSISILFFRHETNILQILGIILVIGTAGIEFLSELMNENIETKHHQSEREPLQKFERIEQLQNEEEKK